MTVTVLAGLALTIGAPALKDPPAKAPNIVGEWDVESVTVNGMPSGIKGGTKYTFTADGKWLIERSGKPIVGPDRGFKTDPKASPPKVDLISSTAAAGTLLLGIYKVEGDTLTICGRRGNDVERPTSFDDSEGSGTTVYVLKRAKKE